MFTDTHENIKGIIKEVHLKDLLLKRTKYKRHEYKYSLFNGELVYG